MNSEAAEEEGCLTGGGRGGACSGAVESGAHGGGRRRPRTGRRRLARNGGPRGRTAPGGDGVAAIGRSQCGDEERQRRSL